MTREQAIEVLNMVEAHGSLVIQAKNMAIQALQADADKWIPVSERIPEYGKEVLTCSDGGFIEIQSLEDSYDGYWENQKGDWTDFDEIVAWMPLPSPYMGVSE